MRCNRQIRISPVRVIDQDENQVGVLPIEQAQQMANQAGLDLVEVAPQARPPVCKIMDFGKWKYEQKKKERAAKVNRTEITIKEVRMRPKTDSHDQLIKINHAKDFLAKGHKVQFTMQFRGREMAHQDLGRASFNAIKKELEPIAKLERDFRMEGRRLTMILAPLTTKDRPATPRPPRAGAPAAAAPAPVAPAPAAPPAASEAQPQQQPAGE